MTTNANKHGLRAAAAQRSNRHAQRTPLPPRPADLEAAREPVANGEAPDARSWGKAKAFADKAGALGWAHSTAAVGDAVELTASRGSEILVQAWSHGVWEYGTSFYAYGDRNTKPRNASGAAKLLERAEADAAAEANKVASNKHFRKAEPKDITVKLEEAQRSLPFHPELATDEEVGGILAGQALSWFNRLSRGTESGIVGRKGVRFSRLPDGARVITFCCPVTGYRSCLVTSILKVGRGKASKTTESALVEVA